MSKTKSKIITFVSAFLPWIQLLQIYGFISGITLGYLGIIFCAVLLMMAPEGNNHKRKYNVSKGLFVFIAIAIILIPFSIFFSSEVLIVGILNRSLKVFLVFFTIYLFYEKGFDFKSYFKSLRVLALIACLGIVYQFISFKATGQYYSFKLPFFKYANNETDAKYGYIEYTYRFGSIFTEPSHFVYFIFQYFVLRMFLSAKNKIIKLVELSFISLCVMLSISSSGIIILGLLWVFYLIFGNNDGYSRGQNIFLFKLSIVVLICIGVLFFIKNSNLNFALYRLSSDYDRSNVVWKRLYSNFGSFLKLDKESMIVGLGLGNIENVFMNSFVYILLTTGFIGFILIICWLFYSFLKVNLLGKTLLIVLVLLMAIDMCFFTPTLLGYCVPLVYCTIYPKGELKNERCSIYYC